MAFRAQESHIGSALTMVDIIEAIYQVKNKKDHFVLSAGHSVPALYAVLENHGLLKKPDLKKLGNHPERNPKNHIEVSSGSLGQGLPIAVGMALGNKAKRVFCCISDGECFEGSIWEALRIGAENNLTNLIVIVNCNCFAAYRETHPDKFRKLFKASGWKTVSVNGHNLKALKGALRRKKNRPTLILAQTRVDQLPFLKGIAAHYHKMSVSDYKVAKKICSAKLPCKKYFRPKNRILQKRKK